VTFRIIAIVVTIGLAFLWRDYWALVIGLLAGRVLGTPITYAVMPFWPRLSLRSWRHLIGFSFWSWMGTMLAQVKERGDSIIVGRMLGTAQVGIFAVGSEFGTLPVTEVVEPLGRVLFSGFALLHRSDESPRRLYLGAIGTVILLILPAGLGISMVAEPMVRVVLGAQWLNVVPIIQIIAMFSPVAVFSVASGTFLTAGGRPRAVFLLSCISMSIRIPLMIAMIYLWGLPGAAAGVGIALMIDQGVFLWHTMRQLGITVIDLLSSVWRPVVASLVMVGCLNQFGMAWTQAVVAYGWPVTEDLATRCALGAATYAIALILTWQIVGRPDGVERELFTIARRWLRLRASGSAPPDVS
jgi:O-antigen/teichoic acid export membrane protein